MDIKEVTKNLNKHVKLDNTEYVLKECVTWRSEVDNQIMHSLVLKDLNANSTVRVGIGRVEII